MTAIIVSRDHRAATEVEAESLMTNEEIRRSRTKAKLAVSAMDRRIVDEGLILPLGRTPEGEVLFDLSMPTGLRHWMVLDADGGLGGLFCDGLNTVGKRLQLTPNEIEAFRAAIRRSNE